MRKTGEIEASAKIDLLRTRRAIPWLLLAASLALVVAPAAPDRGSAELTLAGKSISINYGRPDLAGRDLLALARPGMVWRLGTNKATTLDSESDLFFDRTVVHQGRYSLFAKKLGIDHWVLLVNNQTGLWGTTGYDPGNDVASIPLENVKLASPVERLTIVLAKESESRGTLSIRWGESELRTGFRVSEPTTGSIPK